MFDIADSQDVSNHTVGYWPRQVVRAGVACCVVGVMRFSSFCTSVKGDVKDCCRLG